MGVMALCPHEYDAALCRIALKSVALSLSLVGHPLASIVPFRRICYLEPQMQADLIFSH